MPGGALFFFSWEGFFFSVFQPKKDALSFPWPLGIWANICASARWPLLPAQCNGSKRNLLGRCTGARFAAPEGKTRCAGSNSCGRVCVFEITPRFGWLTPLLVGLNGEPKEKLDDQRNNTIFWVPNFQTRVIEVCPLKARATN